MYIWIPSTLYIYLMRNKPHSNPGYILWTIPWGDRYFMFISVCMCFCSLYLCVETMNLHEKPLHCCILFFVTTTAYSWSWWLISLPTYSISNTHTWQNGSIYSMWTQIDPFSLTWMLTLEKSFKPFFVILLDHKMYPKIKFLLNLSSFIWSFQVLNLSFLIWHRTLSALKYVEISDLVSIQIR